MLKSALTVAVAALLIATPAAADPFDSFVSFCLDTNADQLLAADAARSAGWTEIPTDPAEGAASIFLNGDPATFSPDALNLEVLLIDEGSGEEFLNIPSLRLDMCALMLPNSTDDELEVRMNAFLGFTAPPSQGYRLWLYSRDGSRFRAETDLYDTSEEALSKAAQQRQIYMVRMLETDSGDQTLSVGAIRTAR